MNINAGNNINYPIVGPISAHSPVASWELPYNSSEVVQQKEEFPPVMLYRQRCIVYDEAYLVMLSNKNMQTSPDQKESTELVPYWNELEHRYTSWKTTVSQLLEQGVRKGFFVSKCA